MFDHAYGKEREKRWLRPMSEDEEEMWVIEMILMIKNW